MATNKTPDPQQATKRASDQATTVRRDRPGHIDPTYAKELLARGGREPKDPDAFVLGHHSNDDLAEELGEEFVASVTSGAYEGEEYKDQIVPEESGGPFVVTGPDAEFGYAPDASNPLDAEREPFPKT